MSMKFYRIFDNLEILFINYNSILILRKYEKFVIANNFSPAGETVLQCIVLTRNMFGVGEILFYVNDKLLRWQN